MGSKPIELVHFNNISVNILETNSGIFVGNVNANGWHSNNKNNSGFGSSSGSNFEKSISIVFDNDGIDTVITDYTFANETQENNETNTTQNIQFDSINVVAQTIASSISVGENDLRNWRSHSKISHGVGNVAGRNNFSHVINEIIDNDIIDTYVDDTSLVKFNERLNLKDEINSAKDDENNQQETDQSSEQKK